MGYSDCGSVTSAEINCFIGKLPATLDFFRKSGWNTSASNYAAIWSEWCGNATLDTEIKAKYGSADALLKAYACRTGDGNTNPPSGGGGDDSLDKIMTWVKANPIIAAGIGVVAFMLLSGGRRR
jgi:hypothetical protein